MKQAEWLQIDKQCIVYLQLEHQKLFYEQHFSHIVLRDIADSEAEIRNIGNVGNIVKYL